MSTKQVNVPNVGNVTLYKRKGNRSLRLSISHNGDVRVTMPYWLPFKAGEQFAASKAEWITRHSISKVEPLKNGQSVGKAHRIYFLYDSLDEIRTHVTDTEIRIHLPGYESTDSPKAQEAVQKAGIRALRKEAESLLPQRLNYLSSQTGLSYRSVGVKQLKSRWGSCNTSKDIILNLYLMQLPWHLIDYVILHELTHTKVMRHGPLFWKELERHLPKAKSYRKEINGYQPILSSGKLIVA